VTVDQVLKDPGAYYGDSVVLVGDVKQVLGPRSFTPFANVTDTPVMIASAMSLVAR
jgi:hypothetical protein